MIFICTYTYDTILYYKYIYTYNHIIYIYICFSPVFLDIHGYRGHIPWVTPSRPAGPPGKLPRDPGARARSPEPSPGRDMLRNTLEKDQCLGKNWKN